MNAFWVKNKSSLPQFFLGEKNDNGMGEHNLIGDSVPPDILHLPEAQAEGDGGDGQGHRDVHEVLKKGDTWGVRRRGD